MLQTTSGETRKDTSFFKIKDRSEIEESLETLDYILKNVLGYNCANNLTNTATKDSLQNLIYSRSGLNGCLKLIVDAVIRAGIISEKRSAGSSHIFLSTISYFLEDLIRSSDRRNTLSEIKKGILYFCQEIGPEARKLNKQDMDLIINSYFNLSGHSNIISVIKKVIEEESPNSEIIVEKGFLDETSSVKYDGHFLKIEIPQIANSMEKSWVRNNPDVVLVDGFIESVSQIHHILSIYSQSSKPLLLLCRKASEEVSKTIFHNFHRGTLDVILIEVDFDLNYINIFEDFRAIYGCEVVDINMGDTLSSNLEKNIFSVPRIKAKPSGASFAKVDSGKKLTDHIKELKNLKDSSSTIVDGHEQVVQLISERIKFLASGTHEIRIGKSDIKYDQNIVEKIDEFFRSISEISSFGIVPREIIKESGSMGNFIVEKIKSPIFLQKSLAVGLISAYQTLKLFTNAEKMLILDK